MFLFLRDKLLRNCVSFLRDKLLVILFLFLRDVFLSYATNCFTANKVSSKSSTRRHVPCCMFALTPCFPECQFKKSIMLKPERRLDCCSIWVLGSGPGTPFPGILLLTQFLQRDLARSRFSFTKLKQQKELWDPESPPCR